MTLKAQAIPFSPELPKHGTDDKFRMLLEWLPDAVMVHIEDEIVYVNPFCVKLLAAQGPEQLVGKQISEIIKSDHLSPIKDRIRDCYATGKASPPTESTLIALDGSSVDIEAVAIPVFWNGSFAIEVVLRDIRERKIAGRTDEEWQKRLGLVQQAGLRIGLWDWDTATNTVNWSDETYRQFGFTKETFSGRVCDAVPRIHLEDLPRVEKAIQGTLSGHGEYSVQYRLVRPDGSICWVDARGVMAGEGSTHMMGIGIDITDLKSTEQSLRESEEKYRNLFENAAHGIFLATPDGTLLDVNPAIVAMLGYTSKKELLACNLERDIYEDRDSRLSILESYVAAERVESAEARWKRKDGTIIDVHMSGRQVLKQDSSVGHYEVIVEDFTERRKLEAGLEAERLRVVQVTMRTVHDIVNNCLNQLQLLRLDAEDKVPLESLVLFDQAIKETSMKLNAMGDLQAYAEMQMAIGTGLDTKDLFQN
jgi:PAS domain S-box-containing protein